MFFFNGKLTVHTGSGNLSCDLNGAINSAASSQGETAAICEITGGTGVYQSASSHLRLIALTTQSPVVIPSGDGDYRGTIITR